MTTPNTVSPRQRMIEGMTARKLGSHTQRSHIYCCKLFAAFLKRSPDTATADDIRRFQLQLVEAGHSICDRNRIMTGVAPVRALAGLLVLEPANAAGVAARTTRHSRPHRRAVA